MAFCMAMFDVCHVVENLGSWWDYPGLMENEDLIVKAEEDMISNFDEIHTYMLKRHSLQGGRSQDVLPAHRDGSGDAQGARYALDSEAPWS